MARRYFLYLSRDDDCTVWRFPGLEIKDKPGVDWIQSYFLPAIHSLTEGPTKKAVKRPLSFWVKIGRVVDPYPRWEIWVYSTPWAVQNPVLEALAPLSDIYIGGGCVYLPKDAIPYCQIFRGKSLRFYHESKNAPKPYVPAIYWHIDHPVLTLNEPDKDSIMVENPETADPLWVRAEVVGEGYPEELQDWENVDLSQLRNGNYYRRLQMTLPELAIPED